MAKDGETMETVTDFIFLGSTITIGGDCSHEIKRHAPWKKSYDKPRQHIKKQRHYVTNKGPTSQSCVFSSSHVWMWELDHKEGWVPKNWCFRTVVLEKTLSPKSPFDCKEMQPVNPKGNHLWTFTGRIDAELKLQCFGDLMQRTDSLGKTLMLWKIEDRRRKRQQRTKWLDGITELMDISWGSSRRCWRTGKHGDLQSNGITKSWTWLSNWTTTAIEL